MELVFKKTAGGTKYTMFPAQTAGSGATGTARPTLFLLGAATQSMLTNPDFSRHGELMYAQGWNVVSVDPPCHGEDLRPGERAEILGWADRFLKGEDTVAAFVARVNDVIDHLVTENVAKSGSVALMGVSRGGFLALHVAAGNARIAAVCTLAPVMDWAMVREFAEMKENALVKSTALINHVDRITCPVWTIIGSADDRVDTSKAVEVMHRLLANNSVRGKGLAIDFHLTSTPGHQSFPIWHDEAARWLVERALVK
jgi:pimeloyl-ACP methyl ester carboxylesterase